MAKNKTPDFSGYATRVGLKCSDGRTIAKDAFAHNDGSTVPLVYQHIHSEPSQVLGHAVLHNREDGVYADCFLNDSVNAQATRECVAHGDIKALSIYANGLVEKVKTVIHGQIREVSVVLAGANPGAYIDYVAFQHSDDAEPVISEEDAIISAGAFDDDSEIETGSLQHAEETIGDIFETLTDKQKNVVYAMIEAAFEDQNEAKHYDMGDDDLMKNLFDKGSSDAGKSATGTPVLTRDLMHSIIADARTKQMTLKGAFMEHGYKSIADAYAAFEPNLTKALAHDGTYGMDNIGLLFPDYKSTSAAPAFIKRDTTWVASVFGAAKHLPFSRIKTVLADITADEARAKGYIKANQKADEVITLLKRTTDPQTVYKRQRIDRDDMLDITDFDAIVWLRNEMRMMIEEELARAILIGDGRSSASNDKIKEVCVRPIATDDEIYTIKTTFVETVTTSQMIDGVVMARKQYQGSGVPAFFTTPDIAGDMLLLKDTTGRRLYNTEVDLAAALRASKIVEVPVMENNINVITEATSTTDGSQERLIGVMVNVGDYSIGADKGGALTMFDDFDLDFNQYMYLLETRISGALTLPKSAIAFWKTETIPATGA